MAKGQLFGEVNRTWRCRLGCPHACAGGPRGVGWSQAGSRREAACGLGARLALHAPPALADKSKESENSKFEPGLPGACQGGRNGTYFISLLACFTTFKYLNMYFISLHLHPCTGKCERLLAGTLCLPRHIWGFDRQLLATQQEGKAVLVREGHMLWQVRSATAFWCLANHVRWEWLPICLC